MQLDSLRILLPTAFNSRRYRCIRVRTVRNVNVNAVRMIAADEGMNAHRTHPLMQVGYLYLFGWCVCVNMRAEV